MTETPDGTVVAELADITVERIPPTARVHAGDAFRVGQENGTYWLVSYNELIDFANALYALQRAEDHHRRGMKTVDVLSVEGTDHD